MSFDINFWSVEGFKASAKGRSPEEIIIAAGVNGHDITEDSPISHLATEIKDIEVLDAFIQAVGPDKFMAMVSTLDAQAASGMMTKAADEKIPAFDTLLGLTEMLQSKVGLVTENLPDDAGFPEEISACLVQAGI
ncbi:MAG TPA: hypothetical protein PKW15_07615, partial [Alphaproteobacteria bacterium]|nr:hypothetical protein [Alphaproteobacteria bacterium]